MIRDVKSYFNKVGERLTNVFNIHEFDLEDQVEFWALASDLCARTEVPPMNKIAAWVDLAFKAPVHIVYRKEGEKLLLFRQHIISQNLQHLNDGTVEQEMHKFDEQVSNLEPKIKYSDTFLRDGIVSLSIGKCQAIPLHQGDQFWGLYCVGPYTEIPEALESKITILSKILSNWLAERHLEQKERRYNLSTRIQQTIKHEASSEEQIENIAHYIIGYILQITNAKGALLASYDKFFKIIQNVQLPEELIFKIDEAADHDDAFDLLHFHDNHTELFSQHHFNTMEVIEISEKDRKISLYLFGDHEGLDLNNRFEVFNTLTATLVNLCEYNDQIQRFNDKLIATYNTMIRDYERQSKKTAFHTSRLVSFCQMFGERFGLTGEETSLLLKTAKLHDLGYVCTEDKTIGVEIEHPKLGAMMLDGLKLPAEIVNGVAAHHEWVDGSGTPYGLKDEEIPWTAKVIAIFEYIVNFIENRIWHADIDHDEDEPLRELISTLLDRAGREFDMLLIPTVIELLGDMGWEECCEMGTAYEN